MASPALRFGANILEPQVESLTQLQEQQPQAFLDMNRLLTTLGTTMLGALGFPFGQRQQGSTSVERTVACPRERCFCGSLHILWVRSLRRNSIYAQEPVLWPGSSCDPLAPQDPLLCSAIERFLLHRPGYSRSKCATKNVPVSSGSRTPVNCSAAGWTPPPK